jgi:hypothetical protein
MTRLGRCHLEPGAPASSICPPIAHSEAGPPRTAKGKKRPEPPAAMHVGRGRTDVFGLGVALPASAEHGEDGEDAFLPAASTVAYWSWRWVPRRSYQAAAPGCRPSESLLPL